MRASSSFGALALLAAGCAANRYEPPPVEDPHATVLVRVAYLDPPKALFREAVTVDGEKLAMARPDAKKASAVTRELRVPPKPTTMAMKADVQE